MSIKAKSDLTSFDKKELFLCTFSTLIFSSAFFSVVFWFAKVLTSPWNPHQFMAGLVISLPLSVFLVGMTILPASITGFFVAYAVTNYLKNNRLRIIAMIGFLLSLIIPAYLMLDLYENDEILLNVLEPQGFFIAVMLGIGIGGIIALLKINLIFSQIENGFLWSFIISYILFLPTFTTHSEFLIFVSIPIAYAGYFSGKVIKKYYFDKNSHYDL